MTYAITYSSRTGNTEMLAKSIQSKMPESDCIYYGVIEEQALQAERLYVGFWTDKGTCDEKTKAFLTNIHGKEIFLFGTAGFGADDAYFQKVLNRVMENIDGSNKVIGTYMCQGKMPMAVRERYEKMLHSENPPQNIKAMIQNFDAALSHPDEKDLEQLQKILR